MKTKFILLCSFFIFSSFLARGQTKSDTLELLNAYAQAESEILLDLNERLEEQGELKIDRLGRFSSPFSEAMENTIIRFALENRDAVKINLEYFEFDFYSLQKEEEYHLQRTFEEYYPDRLIDFLELKMFYDDPLTLDILSSSHDYLLLANFHNNFDLIKTRSLKYTRRVDVDLMTASIYVNDVPLIGLEAANARMSSLTEACSFDHCFLSCLNIQYDVLWAAIGAYCPTICGLTFSPLGLTGLPETGCIACLGGAAIWIGACVISCEFDPCNHGYDCVPGEPTNSPPRCFNGVREREYCSDNGQGDFVWKPDPCPEGTVCYGSGVCLPCPPPPSDGPTRPQEEPTHGQQWFLGEGGSDEENNVNRDIPSCDLSINEFNTTVENPDNPQVANGAIVISASTSNIPIIYQWDDLPGPSGPNRTGLTAGKYCVTLRDNYCCYIVRCFTLIDEECQGLEWTPTISSFTACNDLVGNDGIADDGEIEINVSLGFSMPTYSWSNGATSPSIGGLIPGIYYVTVTDENGCTDSRGVVVDGKNANYPTVLHGDVTGVCTETGNSTSGAINVYPESTVPIFSYTWSNGANSQFITNLGAGTYTVTVTDECQDEYIESFVVGPLEVESEVVHNSISCECNGVIEISLSGGKKPYQVFHEGPNGAGVITTEESTIQLTELCTGGYTIDVVDGWGCTYSMNQNICDCPDIQYGEWIYNEVSQEYCRTFTQPGSTLCEPLQDQECFTPYFPPNQLWVFNEVTEQYCRNVYYPNDGECAGDVALVECFNPIYSDWYESIDPDYPNEPGVYCQTITCTGEYFCSTLEIYECENYTLENCIPHPFDNAVCVCQVFVEGEFIDEFKESTKKIEWDYDQGTNKCIQIIYCNNDVSDMTYQDPIGYGDWEFDTGNEVCTRMVICSDEQEEEFAKIENNPTVNWAYNSSSGLCVATVDCDNNFWGDVEVTEPPLFSNWGFIDQGANSPCTAIVNCGFNGNYQPVDEYAEAPEVLSWQILTDAGFLCDISISCGGGQLYSSYASTIYTKDTYYGWFYDVDLQENVWTELCLISCYPDGFGLDLEVPCADVDFTDSGELGFRNNVDFEKILTHNLNRINTESVSIIPNPFDNEVLVTDLPLIYGDLLIEILNSNGEVISKSVASQTGSLKINTSKLSKGIYFIRVHNENHTFSKSDKIVKVK